MNDFLNQFLQRKAYVYVQNQQEKQEVVDILEHHIDVYHHYSRPFDPEYPYVGLSPGKKKCLSGYRYCMGVSTLTYIQFMDLCAGCDEDVIDPHMVMRLI